MSTWKSGHSELEPVRSILKRLDDCPTNLVRSECASFKDALTAVPQVQILLELLISEYQGEFGTIAATLAHDPNSDYSGLEFIDSGHARAAFGILMLNVLLTEQHTRADFLPAVTKLGLLYLGQKGFGSTVTTSQAIREFSRVFLAPVVDFLESQISFEDSLIGAIRQYKLKTESLSKWRWDGNLPKRENDLSYDFFAFLFDQGIPFSIESRSTADGSRVDCLVPSTSNHQLPIEIKIFDGKKRGKSYLEKGLAQSWDYARRFDSPLAIYLVFIIAENYTLNFPGSPISAGLIMDVDSDRRQLSVSVNLNWTLSASEAGKATVVDVAKK